MSRVPIAWTCAIFFGLFVGILGVPFKFQAVTYGNNNITRVKSESQPPIHSNASGTVAVKSENTDLIPGTYKLVSSEKFEEYLKALGVSLIYRKLIASAKLQTRIEGGNGIWRIRSWTFFRSHEIDFKLATPFKETTPDYRTCDSIITIENNGKRMVHKQNYNLPGVPLNVITRDFTKDQMIMKMVAGPVECTRVYKRVVKDEEDLDEDGDGDGDGDEDNDNDKFLHFQ